MSWIYIPEEVEGYLEESSSDGKQFAPSSEMNTVKTSSSKGRKRVASLPFRSTPRQILSRANRGDGWIASWREYLANRFPLPEPAKPSSMSGINGKTSSGFSAKWSRSTSSWRMFPGFSDLPYILDGSSDNWPRAGIVLGTKYAPQDPSEPTISAKDCGSTDGEDELFRTPTATQPGIRPEMLVDKNGDPPKRGQRVYNRKTGKLKNLGLLQQIKLWPTPNSADHKQRGNLGNPSIQRRKELGKQLDLSMVVSDEKGKTLSPLFVSFLMGWPDGWSNLSPLPKGSLQEWKEKTISGRWWLEEPDRPRILPAKEIENRINQLKVLGNGMVPLCFVSAYLELSGS